MLEQALAAATSEPGNQARALRLLALGLPERQRTAVLDKALAAAGSQAKHAPG